MSNVNVGTLEKQPTEDLLFYFDFNKLLNSSETLSGTPTVTGSPSGLTIGSASIVSADTTALGRAVLANRAVQVRISGGTDDVDYTVQCSCGTSSSNTRVIDGTLSVRDS